MAANGYNFYLSRILETGDQPNVASGASGYFSTPSNELDPHLFQGDHFRDDVRHWVLRTLYDYWRGKYRNPEDWSTVWVAGSAITYQWAAKRGGLGDVDILVGVDFPGFFHANPSYAGISEREMASLFNADFHEELWPKTAEQNINGRAYEVTFYVNPGATDIRDIRPYAAYNLSDDSWTVRPPELPENPRSLYPKKFWDAVDAEKKQAMGLVDRYHRLKSQAEAMAPGTPGFVNTMSALRLVISQATDLFNDIHAGRRNAFGPGGSGYGDYYNFRWQAHKEAGTVQALHALTVLGRDAGVESATALYGEPVEAADKALMRAALWNTPYRR